MSYDTINSTSSKLDGQYSAPVGHPIQGWQISADFIEVSWADGYASQHPYALLRDWCLCNRCTDRRLVSSEAMLDVEPTCTPGSVSLQEDGTLRIVWKSDGHISRYSMASLQELDTQVRRTHQHRESASTFNDALPVFDYPELQDDDKCWLDVLHAVSKSGFALLKSVPDDPDELATIGSRVGYVPGGWRYYSKPEGILVAATNNKAESARSVATELSESERHYQRTLLVPHTDFSFTSWPTGLFLFHCLSPSADLGGETILVDGFHIAERLRVEDPDSFNLLSSVRQPFCGHGESKIDWRALGRVISVDSGGNITGIRFAMASRMPLTAPAELIKPYYQATQRMLRLVLNPDAQMRLSLKAGECLIIDNHRTLHGRTGMDPIAGQTRRFRRFDVERDAAQTQILRLAKQTGNAALPLPSGAHC